jgi:hypothetical protein
MLGLYSLGGESLSAITLSKRGRNSWYFFGINCSSGLSWRSFISRALLISYKVTAYTLNFYFLLHLINGAATIVHISSFGLFGSTFVSM